MVGSPCSPRDSQESSPTPQFKSNNSSALSFLYSPTLTSIHGYWKTIALTRQTFVGKVMSLLFNMLLGWSSEKAMAPHSSTLAWKIPWTEEPGRLHRGKLSPWGHKELDTTELLNIHTHTHTLLSLKLSSLSHRSP